MMTRKFNWFYQPNLVMMGVGELSVSKIEKVGLVFYTVPYSFYYKRVSLFLLYFPSLLYSWKSINRFHFLRSVLQNRCSQMFTQENTGVGVLIKFLIKLQTRSPAALLKRFAKFLRTPFFTKHIRCGGCFCNFQVNYFIFSF